MGLLLEAFIYLAAGVIAVPLASRLGLGSVLGYLIAGALIGPHVLGLVNDAEHIMHFGEFGVVMMLFLIGLELQPSVLWRLRGPIIGMGGLQVVATTIALTVIALLFGLNWQAALAVGLILSLSSTALALQLLSEKGLMSESSGKSGFAVLLFQDIAVIPTIALLPLLATSSNAHMSDPNAGYSIISHLAGWQQTLIVFITIATIILVGRFLSRPMFNFIASSHLREIFTAAALFLVVGIALVMNLVGLSPALGAFIAGVVLAESEYRHELEANIAPFKGLLLGLFFVSVGAGIDFDLFGEKALLMTSIVAGLVTIKFIILWLLAKTFYLSGGERYWFAFALAQGGEFGFVLLSLALQGQVLDKPTVDLLTASIALSMVTTPLLMLLNEKIIQPRFETAVEQPPPEVINEQDNPAIIAGFGRFGQVVGRLLVANGYKVTVLDHSASRVERLRLYGFKLYYGDGSREELLHTAGAADAKLLVVAVDDPDKINAIVRTARRNFPDLTIIARAQDAMHCYELEALGVDFIEREVFQSSLSAGERALRVLGMRAYQAKRQAARFARHDKETLKKLSAHREDSKRYISESKRSEENLLAILQSEKEAYQQDFDAAWDTRPEDDQN
ncbi:MAG: monovalent cation:proton antiporter-2 (CPA2) family protein [Thiotrichales bacterium]